MKKLPPTKKELELLNYIKGFFSRNGFMPILDEAAEYLNITRQAVWYRRKGLEKKGFLKVGKGKPRDITIVKR